MIELRVSVACRTCSSGWYGAPGDRCPRCRGEVVVTDVFAAVDLADLDVIRSGFAGDRCPRCRGEVVVTDTFSVVDLGSRVPDAVA